LYKKIILFLKKPFNLESYISNKLNLSLLHGLFVFVFLNIFKPFKLDNLKEDLFGYTILMGVLTFLVPFLFFFILEKIKFKNWFIYSFIGLTLFFSIIYSFTLWYFSGIYKDIFSLNKLSFIVFYKYCSSLAIISIIFMLIVNDKLLRLKSEKINRIKEDEITLYSENKKENITIHINKLIYITIDGNYASFFIETGNGIKELILRNTLSNILKQTTNYPFIFRCHKSYIINSLFFNEIIGNARGYSLKSNRIENKIPVSRSLHKVDLEKLLQK
tara:strand:+ start:2584 stop:3405 length:822 start_codon:yes stop_codon:yes gene_type:complete